MSTHFLKALAIVLVTVAGTGASANSYFEYGNKIEDDGILDLGLITVDDDAVVEIYEFQAGTVGELVATEDLHAGANSDVRVNTGLPVGADILAVVRIDGQVVAEKEFDVQ